MRPPFRLTSGGFGPGALVAAVFCLTAGCERSVVRSDYFPLRDGNRWDYRLLDAPLLKHLAEGRTIETESEAAVVNRPAASEAPAQAWDPEMNAPAAPAAPRPRARRVSLCLKNAVDEVTFRAVYDDFEQVWSKRGGYLSFQDARGRHYLLILPPHTGYRWIVTETTGENRYCEIEGHQDLNTPAGFFPLCAVAREETKDRKTAFRYWFAPDTGLVRRSKYFMGEEVFRQELVDRSVLPELPETARAGEREVDRALRDKQRGNEHRRPGAPRQLEAREPESSPEFKPR